MILYSNQGQGGKEARTHGREGREVGGSSMVL